MASYARRMSDEGRFGEMEALLAQIGAAEYAAQISGGVAMSQGEIARGRMNLACRRRTRRRFSTRMCAS